MSKVRCGDCDNIRQRGYCSVKNIEVSRKKPIECDLFTVKVKRDPEPPVYVPAFDKKTRKILTKLIKAGVLNEKDEVNLRVGEDGQTYQQKLVEVPLTSASAKILNTTGQTEPGIDTCFDPFQENEPV